METPTVLVSISILNTVPSLVPIACELNLLRPRVSLVKTKVPVRQDSSCTLLCVTILQSVAQVLPRLSVYPAVDLLQAY